MAACDVAINFWQALSLGERLRESGANVAAYAVHPGLIGAELQRTLDFPGGGILYSLAKGRVTKTPSQAAATVLVCATHDGLGKHTAGVGPAGHCSPRQPTRLMPSPSFLESCDVASIL